MQIRFTIGLTALFLIGAASAALVLKAQTPNAPRKIYPPDPTWGVVAYDLTDSAHTSYGWFTADTAHLDESGSQTRIDITAHVDNEQFAPLAAPTLAQVRVVTTEGAEATYLGGGWRGDSPVFWRSSRSGEFQYAVPDAGGMLILEYREPGSDTPVHVVVGYARPHTASQPAAQ